MSGAQPWISSGVAAPPPAPPAPPVPLEVVVVEVELSSLPHAAAPRSKDASVRVIRVGSGPGREIDRMRTHPIAMAPARWLGRFKA